MRLRFPFAAAGIICIAQSTSGANPSDHCCVRIAAWTPRKSSSARLSANRFRLPTTVNLDGNAASHRALRLLGDEDPQWKPVVVRCCRYLNNIVEQDHRAIKRRCASMLGLKSFETAALRRRRTRESNSQAAILIRARWSTGPLVAETAVGSGAGAVAAFRSTAGTHSSLSTANAPELTGQHSQ